MRNVASYWLAAIAMASAGAQDPELKGVWQGSAVRDSAVLPLTLRFAPDGTVARLDAPSQSVFGLPSRIQRDGNSLRFDFRRYQLRLELDAADGALRGEMRKRSARRRVATVELLRVPRPPIPEAVAEEVRIESADGTALAGTIFRPRAAGPHPGILFVQGRSYGSRYGHYSLAVAAARRGIASLIFDGRGAGRSGGQRGRHTLQQRLDDAEAALGVLREHSEVDADRVGLFGHSAGGWVVPVVAQRAGPVAFLVLNAGPVGSLAEQQGQVVRELLRRSGEESEEHLESAFAYERKLVELTASGTSWSDIAAHVETATGQPWAKTVDKPANEQDAELDYFRRNPHDNTEALRKTTVPVLALYGEDDYIVPPRYNTPALEEHLGAAGNTDFRIEVFARADHNLTMPERNEDGAPFLWSRTPPGYVDTIFDWLLVRVGS